LRCETIHEATRSGFVRAIWCDFVDHSYVIGGNTRNETQTLPKSKGADLPQSRRLTLQSQFSQGEWMAGILNLTRRRRVAKTLWWTCEAISGV